MPQPGAQSPRGTSVPPRPLLPHHSPAPLWLQQARQGHVPPGDPSEGEERSCRGSPAAPAPGCAHLAAQPGRARGPRTRAWPMGSVISASPPGTSRHRGGPARHPAGLPPPTTPATCTGLNAQSVAGYAHTQTQVTAACTPHAVAHGQGPRAVTVPWGHGKLSPGGAAWGAQLPAPQPLPRTRFRPQLQPGVTHCLPILPGRARHG